MNLINFSVYNVNVCILLVFETFGVVDLIRLIR